MGKVLIVDDSAFHRNELKHWLNGYLCTEADNGEEALRLVKLKRLDIIITDYHMPVMDGLALSAQVRLLHDKESLPIVMLTTDTSKELRQRGKEAGINAFLAKPASEESLIKVVQFFAQKRPA